MQKLASLLGLLLASAASAFVVPESLENGIWLFSLDESGNALSGPIPAVTPDKRSSLSSLLSIRQQNPPPIPSPKLACGSSSINAGDFGEAQQLFDTMCDRAQQYPANMAVVLAAGNSIAYMCNFGTNNRCWRQEYDEAIRIMDAGCGVGRAAWVQIDAYQKSYGRANKGDDIC